MTVDLTLAALAEGARLRHLRGPVDPRVAGVTSDSRRVEPGFTFVAIRGESTDGHAYLSAAIERGATALVVTRGAHWDAPVPRAVAVYETDDARDLLGRIVARLHAHPDRDLTLVAVTGTNGKTTVSHVVRDLLGVWGRPCGLVGTIRYETGARSVPAPLTTPGVEDLFGLWAEMRDAGLQACSLEASSHALHQRRLGPAEVDVAAFLNVTREHLDYHRDLDDYLAAKLRLLEHLDGPQRAKPRGVAVVNADDPMLSGRTWPEGTVFVGRGEACDVRGVAVRCDRQGTTLDVEIEGTPVSCRCALLGRYNAQNLLVAVGIAHALGYAGDAVASACAAIRPVPGRLEKVDLPGGPLAVVDYAHTPDGIRSALTACRELVDGRIILVFGCGGDRDRGKRPLMAQAALEGAEEVILTLDNPRTEDPGRIFRETEAGFGSVSAPRARRVEDRQAAITEALRRAQAADVVLVAGKGHETYQIVGRDKLPWDDRAALRTAWRDVRGGVS
jgi:UDP-N-acetylmuramoyl-L-alanyl-D-glutamate--2,6-diaminopimelate ligase